MARPPAASDDASGPSAPEPARGYARMRAADDAARAALRPLERGERPLAVKASAALAAGLAAGNLALAFAGWDVRGSQPSTGAAVGFATVMLAGAIGIWRMRHWALVACQALLAVGVVFAALSLLVASDAQAVALCAAVIGVCGTLFWFLVRVLARLGLPPAGTR